MGTSTLKAVILIAVVAVGALVLRGAFPENVSEGIAPAPAGGATPRVGQSPSISPSNPPSPTQAAKLRKKRTTTQVLNGTDKTGFAGEWTLGLQADGWKTTDPHNGNTTEVTRIFYRPQYLAEAQAIKDDYFPTAELAEAGTSVPAEVEIQILLGADAPDAPPSG